MPFTYTTRDGRVFEWTGLKIAICTKCDEIFNSVHAFDKHIGEDGEHLWPEEVGLVEGKRGYWVTGTMPENAYKPA